MSTRVVAAVIVRRFPDGVARVLACRRTRPAALAGRWEFPGGKVELGEDDVAALCREIDEELAVRIRVQGPIGGELPMVGATAADPGVWQPYAAVIEQGEPRLVDHDELRWLAPDELADVAWLGSDVPVLAEVRAMLTR